MSKSNLPKEEIKDVKDTMLNLQNYLTSSKCIDSLSNGCIMLE